jgi:uncharacterized membrane protein
MDEIKTLSVLATTVGATLVTLAIVQAIKPLSFLQKIDTRLMVLIIALILTQVGAYFVGSGLEMHLIGLINAFIVTSSAMGTYEVTLKKGDEAKKAGQT